jgi:mono/diheme cytochrome c family protein
MTRLRLVALLLLACGASPALAAGDRIDTSPGHQLATAWCARCHAVERGDFASPEPDVPSFAAVGSDDRLTETAIRVFLRTDHPRMPNIKLSQAETDQLVDYLLSLRPEPPAQRRSR